MEQGFLPITTISLTPLVLQVHPSVPAKTLKEFFELAKRDPGKLNMASPGAGTTNHLLSELLQPTAGVSWTTVHYKGNAPATNDLIAGHVQFNFDQISVALPFIKDGRTRALAVTGTKRAHWIPDVPTFAELGYKDITGQTFTALMAPAGTPAPVIAKLNAAMTEICAIRMWCEIRPDRRRGSRDVARRGAQVSGQRGRDLDAGRAQGEHQGGVIHSCS